jgi:hypothetical protein
MALARSLSNAILERFYKYFRLEISFEMIFFKILLFFHCCGTAAADNF